MRSPLQNLGTYQLIWQRLNMNKGQEIYSGKAKTIYETDDPSLFIMAFRDDATAFDAVKHAEIGGKGKMNNALNAFFMTRLAEQGIATHFVKTLSDTESIVKRLQMLPIECVIRNVAAGSICRRLPVEEGTVFAQPLFEFFYKDDALHDPLINEEHILSFGWATETEISELKSLTRKINQVLTPLFASIGLTLVDYKLEFGRFQGQLLLGDEFTPDGCRLWDQSTGEKLDKDRFRFDLGDLLEGYAEIAKRLELL